MLMVAEGIAIVPAERCHPERSEGSSSSRQRDVILSAAKDLRRPDRGPSIGTPKILRLTAQDDKVADGSGSTPGRGDRESSSAHLVGTGVPIRK